MPATISISASVDSALRLAFSQASDRVKPETLMSSVIAALQGLGIKVEITDGVLCLAQGETQMNPMLALRNFSKRPENAEFFVIEGSHPKQWSTEKKIEFLRNHSDEEYRKLVQEPVLEAGIKTMDPNMSRKAYEGLTRFERMTFIREYGDDAVRRIYQR